MNKHPDTGFVISSERLSDGHGLEAVLESNGFVLYSKQGVFERHEEFLIYYEGYFMPRECCFSDYSDLSGSPLIFRLFVDFGPDFILKIKGFFMIAIVTRETFHIYNDVHSVNRFYYLSVNQSFHLSNSISVLKGLTGEVADIQFAAHLALFQHAFAGQTIYRNIQYSDYASHVWAQSGRLRVEKYWDTSSLGAHGQDMSVDEFIILFNRISGNYLKYFAPETIMATVTGGRDTRSVIASLLSNGGEPHLFTFGNPKNRDVVVGRLISESCGLQFSNPDISNPEAGARYRKLVNKLIGQGNQFIHLHRAHRLNAIETVSEELKYDAVFVGAMGGDYIKGSSFDDYIVSEFIRKLYFERDLPLNVLIERTLEKHFLKYDQNLTESLNQRLQNIPFLSFREFNSNTDLHIAHDIIGCTHDIQDIIVFSNYVGKVIAPFMDIDIMEAIFKTRYSLLSNSRNSNSLVKRLLGGEMQARLVQELCPTLADIPYANYYRPKDVTGSKAKYIFKRGLAYIKQKRNPSVSGFDYGKWFTNYVEEELEQIRDSEVCEFYDIDKMIDTFRREEHLTHEGHWHRYTNPITISRYLIKNG